MTDTLPPPTDEQIAEILLPHEMDNLDLKLSPANYGWKTARRVEATIKHLVRALASRDAELAKAREDVENIGVQLGLMLDCQNTSLTVSHLVWDTDRLNAVVQTLPDRARAFLAEHEAAMANLKSLQDAYDGRAPLQAKIKEMEEWKDCVSSAVQAIPEYTTGDWGGDKSGWGFHFELVNWLQRRRVELEANQLPKGCMFVCAVCRDNPEDNVGGCHDFEECPLRTSAAGKEQAQ